MKNVVIIRNAASSDFGGGERFPVLLATVLKSEGYHTVVLSSSKKLLDFAKLNKIDNHSSWWWSHQHWDGKNALLIPVYYAWQLVLYVYYVLRFIRLRPDVVHIQSKDDFIAATWAAKTLGARIIWTDHADLKHIFKNIDKPLRNLSGKMVALAAKSADAITVVSKSELRFVLRHVQGYPTIHKKLCVVYNGAFDTAVDHPRHNQKNFTYVYVGRLVKEKGVGELIDAFNELIIGYPSSQLIVVGDGPDRKIFESKHNNGSIHFVGHQDTPQEYLALADVFVYPTYHEGFSLSLVEAAMMSLPIITTDVGGNPEIIIDHQTGILVPPKNSRRLYEAMVEMYEDRSLRHTVSHAARSLFVKSFQFDKIVRDNFIKLYEANSQDTH